MTDGVDFDNLADEDLLKLYEDLVEGPEDVRLARYCFTVYAGSNAAGSNEVGTACIG